MNMTLKQKTRLVERAEKKMREAAECLSDLQSMAREYRAPTDREELFADGLRERAAYWEQCTWWKGEPD